MKSTDALRIGDADRDAAISALTRHFADGRLTQSEHEERVERVLTARTAGDLRHLFADLPRLDVVEPPPTHATASAARVQGTSALRGIVPMIVRLLTVAALVVLLAHLVSVIVLVAFAFIALRLVFGARRTYHRVGVSRVGGFGAGAGFSRQRGYRRHW